MVKVTDDRLTYINMNKFYDLYLGKNKGDRNIKHSKARIIWELDFLLFLVSGFWMAPNIFSWALAVPGGVVYVL